jgi:hypothetical protein
MRIELLALDTLVGLKNECRPTAYDRQYRTLLRGVVGLSEAFTGKGAGENMLVGRWCTHSTTFEQLTASTHDKGLVAILAPVQ